MRNMEKKMEIVRRAMLISPGLAAGALLVLDVRQLPDLFLRANPTMQGSFSLLHVQPFVSVAGHLCVLVLALYLALGKGKGAKYPKVASWICFGALAIELLALAPCLLAPDALCGLFYTLLNMITAPVMLAAFVAFLFRAGDARLIQISTAGAILLVVGSVAAYWQFTPKSARECNSIADELKRGACIMNFALRDSDEALCDQVSFDSSRWSCLYEIAERKGMPALCEQITLPCRFESPGVQCDVENYRDTCYLVVARKLKDEILCDHVTDTVKQAGCREQSTLR